ncbi:hypothetical protein KFE17_13855 [Faecalicatena sp. Marseille-Q4148]|nr:hypothetical protein KFE17_13855 [Faecalicatena sp. Marseille-Q4148]
MKSNGNIDDFQMHSFYPIFFAKFEIEKLINDFLKKVYEDKKLKEGEEKMYGAILGDMLGSSFEFDEVTKSKEKSKEFPLFGRWSQYTDQGNRIKNINTKIITFPL